MARFFRQVGACTGGRKGAGLSACNARSRGRRDPRSVERAAGAISRPVSYLRSDPSTLTARQPAPFAGLRKRRQPWPTQRWSRSPAGDTSCSGDMGVLEPSHRGGEHGSPGARRRRRVRSNRPRALHSAVLGPCCSAKQFTELLPSTEAARQARGHRLERGDAPARGTRRGSSDGMAPWRHLTTGSNAGRARPRTVACHRTGASRACAGWKHPGQVNEVAGPSHGGSGLAQAGPRTRTEAGASRGGGFTARGRARASTCVAEIGRQPQAHRSPLEIPMLLAHVRGVGP